MAPIRLKKILCAYAPYVLFVLILLLRAVYANNLRINSDEPQHLHIMWGWANGFMQYRDVFDNHAPLFHIVFAPVYSLFGERADIVVLMRLVVIPLYFVALWAVYLIGKALYSRQAGFWAAVFTGLYPGFFMTSLEFRADDLWMMLWFLTIAVMVQKPLTPLRLFFAGLLLGATFSTSMKTALLLSALALALLSTIMFVRSTERRNFRKFVLNGLPVIAGFMIIPTMLVMYFDSQEALGPMYYGLVLHNIVPGLASVKHIDTSITERLVALVLLILGGSYLLQSPYFKASETGLQRRRMVVFLTYGLGMLGLYGFWPLVTCQDFLPLIPLVIIIITGSALEFMNRRQSTTRWLMQPTLILAVFAMLEISSFLSRDTFRHQHLLSENNLLAEVLQLTRPGESIMDLKGETVFRERPFFYALEGVTRKRIQLGLIKDSIADDMARSGTTVATLDSPFFPPDGREFLNRNFLKIGKLRVAGLLLNAQSANARNEIEFHISIPANYVLIAESGPVRGWLDNTPYDGSRQLEPGRHTFRADSDISGQLAIIWAPAIERGFSPFNLDHRS